MRSTPSLATVLARIREIEEAYPHDWWEEGNGDVGFWINTPLEPERLREQIKEVLPEADVSIRDDLRNVKIRVSHRTAALADVRKVLEEGRLGTDEGYDAVERLLRAAEGREDGVR